MSHRSSIARPWHFGAVVAACWLPALFSSAGCDARRWLDDSRAALDSPSGRILVVNTVAARQTASYRQRRSFTGIIKPRRSSDLSFARAGKIVRLLVELGAEVEADDPIAEQETSQLLLRKKQLSDARQQAYQALGKLIADSQLRSMESVRIEVEKLKTDLQQIKDEVATQAQSSATADARLDNAQQRLDILDAVSGDPQVTAQRSVVADLDRQLAAVDVELSQSKLLAPFAGTISQTYVNDGSMVSPGVPVVRLVQVDSPQAWISIPTDLLVEVEEFTEHRIQVGDRDFEATMSAILPHVDATSRTRTIVFSLNTTDADRPLVGEVARIDWEREIESSGFWLPIASLTEASRGLWSVYAVDQDQRGDQIISRRVVEVLHTDGQRARVRGTLDEGDLIVADGVHRVVPGQRVEPHGDANPKPEDDDGERLL